MNVGLLYLIAAVKGKKKYNYFYRFELENVSIKDFYFYNIRGRLQLTEDSANYVGYCVSCSKKFTILL